ncbi:NADPH-dependent FMN reductase [Enterobacter cancerogenus]|uniref:NADPH-dependent FMN reductase n=1 Tax=Enterobacter cancerogenus TaxID=69218 RepID=UPI000537ED32|nr:NADPH-dependent FMN reductase [Enterobacter cancerogenus]KGT88067.1 FMN reductase [Enterobacter cancerogenus]
MSNGKYVLGISGSLRAASLNTVFLRAMSLLSPVGVTFEIYDSLDKIPLFNVDDENTQNSAVEHWRDALSRAEMVLLVSPEYAHGVTGVIKNALDWIVSSGEFLDKPVSMPNLSVRAHLAHSQLTETLKVMGALLPEACCPRATLEAPYVFSDTTEFSLIENAGICLRLNELWENIEMVMTQ